MVKFVLISGIPRAGKSTFCDAVVAQYPEFTHVPLDKYIKPIPQSLTFLEWVSTPACIDWDLLLEHIDILKSGSHCYTPQVDSNARRKRISHGGPLSDAPGQLMKSASCAYLIPGTHAFAFPSKVSDVFRVFISTPESIVAQRLLESRVGPVDSDVVAMKDQEIIEQYLGRNPEFILAQIPLAELNLNGAVSRKDQVSRFLKAFRSKFQDI